MPNLNKVMLIGNVTRDAEVKYLPSGAAIAQIGLAVTHKYKTATGEQREETTFVDVEFFGKLAEIVGQYVKKGGPVYVEGRLKLDQWEDKQSGQKRSKMKVVADSMQLLGGKQQGQQRQAPPKQAPKPQADPDLDAQPDEIPW